MLLAATTVKIAAFDAEDCGTFVFRTTEGALWHCGDPLPGEATNEWTALYCEHSVVGTDPLNFAWASDHPDDWCTFLVSTVRQSNEDHYALTPEVGINETPGPNVYSLQTIVDWSCYVVEDGVTTEAYLVDSRNGEHASSVDTMCDRSMNYFDYWILEEEIRNIMWHTNTDGTVWYPGYTGFTPEAGYLPEENAWGRCHYDSALTAPHYVPELGVEYAECKPGFYCELKYQDYAACFPDPHADHECCISWNNKCENVGECCAGSECDEWGYCSQSKEQEFEDPPGICDHSTEVKTAKSLYSRCHDYSSGGQGDCAAGYICVGTSWYADCQVDENVKNECCLYNFQTGSRPGDCCLGWYSHCNTHNADGECIDSLCVPGVEMGVDEFNNPMNNVFDRLCDDPPHQASYHEAIGQCTGAVCGVWGDPHIITCDDLHYDCQAVGLFTLMKNHMFNIQAYFLQFEAPWGHASIVNDLAIDYIKDYPENIAPTLQFSFPNFTSYAPDTTDFYNDPGHRYIGACPVLFYVDGEKIDISGVPNDGYLYGDESSNYSVKLTGWNQIDIKHYVVGQEGDGPYYSESVIWIDGSGPYTDWSCILTFFTCLPGEDKPQFENTPDDVGVGLLGTPNGRTNDDWNSPDGQTLLIPDTDRDSASFEYCVENWCVSQDDSILTYPEGSDYTAYACPDQEHEPFDVWTCNNPEDIIEHCEDSDQVIACQIEMCIGNDNVDEEIETIQNITVLDEPTPPEDNLLDNPEIDTEYGDCANLGSGLSGSTGVGAYSLVYPRIGCIWADGFGFSIGYDNSVSVLVGGTFTCKKGAGFEGRGVFMGDMTIEEQGCERISATGYGSLIHPFDNTVCVEVGGDVSIDATFANSKYIMYDYGNSAKSCHLLYGGGCTLNGQDCPPHSDLRNEGVFTEGDFVQRNDINLTRWDDEITLLRQKTDYWKTLEPNGVIEVEDNVMTLKAGPDNNLVQIFEMDLIGEDIVGLVYDKHMFGKTIMIKVSGSGDFNVPPNCYHPQDAMPSDAPICGRDSFPPELTSSTVWVFESESDIEIKGLTSELQGSVVKPWGSLTMSVSGQSGRLIVGGDLTIDGEFTELHNYEYDPPSGPLPLGDDVDAICNITPAPVCEESYKVLTGDTVCPSAPEGIVKLIKSSAELPEGEPVIYDIVLDPPDEGSSAHTVSFRVDNPFTNYTDIFVKHVKKVGDFAMDPTCESMPFTAGCEHEAPTIVVGCHEYEGVDPFALVNIYFASNTDSGVMDIGSSGDVTIDKCCKPPAEYETGYGVVEYTFEIQCVCPEGVTES